MTALWRERPVGIVGLGLIGGSLGLDLLDQGGTVHGLVHRESTAERARQRGLATAVGTDPGLLSDCGLVVLALPLDRLLEPSPELLAALDPGAVVTDVGSVKVSVLAHWRALTPRFVASHPMAGTNQFGVEAGQRNLFAGRPWIATPEAGTDPGALEQVRALAEAVGGKWVTCSAEAHDAAVALISHLPVLVSAGLLLAAEQGAAQLGDELSRLVRILASTGFADTTRVGGGNPELGMLMARSNQLAVGRALACYRQEIERLEEVVNAGSWSELEANLLRAHELRPEFL